ncbi:MAG: NAD(P)H-hydrate dehydratase [Ruminococcaceae bacterium]|nr:NAD(P)H-hydrate dehydratase [Oscillospiraceae bacterium]
MVECGVDIIEIERIKSAVERNESFLGRVFSKNEIKYFKAKGERFETLAGIYAAKEAFVKYKKTGIRGLELSEISVEHESLGAPFVVFRGERMAVSLSISHNKTHAVAVVCGEGGSLPKCEGMKKLIPVRKSDAHKGDCGRVFVVAGSEGMTGAAILAARGALRSGAGLVTVGTVASERQVVACGSAETMTVGLSEKNGMLSREGTEKIIEYAKKSDCVVFGPGLGRCEDIFLILERLLSEYEGKLVLDADGLFALSGNCDILKKRRCGVVLTPHPGEMSFLSGKPVDEIQKNRSAVAVEFAKRYDVTVLLKGKGTVVSGGTEAQGLYINSTGNCGMATGGMGDVLSGIIGAFLAQGMDTFDAAVLGAYIHGKAGDIGAMRLGTHGLLAGDVAELVPEAIRSEMD